jgi:hypothetical protein
MRTHKVEGKEYSASDLAALLKQRKNKDHAKYWDRLVVAVVTVEEKDAEEAIKI